MSEKIRAGEVNYRNPESLNGRLEELRGDHDLLNQLILAVDGQES